MLHADQVPIRWGQTPLKVFVIQNQQKILTRFIEENIGKKQFIVICQLVESIEINKKLCTDTCMA